MFGLALIVWSIVPIYNMVLVALEGHNFEVFSGSLWPPHPSLKSFRVVSTDSYWYLDHFWRQFGNSLYIGLIAMFLTLLIGSREGGCRAMAESQTVLSDQHQQGETRGNRRENESTARIHCDRCL